MSRPPRAASASRPATWSPAAASGSNAARCRRGAPRALPDRWPPLIALLVLVLLAAACSSGGAPRAQVDGGSPPGTAPPPEAATAGAPQPSSPPAPAPTEDARPGQGDGTAPEPEPPAAPTRTAPPSTGAPPDPLRGAVVAIDPGHNGGNSRHPDVIGRPVDAGGITKPCNTTGTASAGGYSEAAFNLDVALLLRAGLEERGATVHLTRSDNTGVGPCIDERGRFGAAVGADLLLSIHADGAEAAGQGFHVIHPTEVPGFTDDIVGPSASLARALRDALVAGRFGTSTYRGVDGLDPRGDLGTLNLSDVPVAMVEAGNMRSAADAAWLESPAGRQRLADSLLEGIAAFLAGEASG